MYGALLEAEGVPLPAEWRGWWVVFSAVCAAGMALVEAGAFAYCLRAWRGMTGRSANVMALMIGASAVTFVVVLSPYIAANVSKVSMSKLLVDDCLLAWSVAVENLVDEWQLIDDQKLQRFKEQKSKELEQDEARITDLKKFELDLESSLTKLETRLDTIEKGLAQKGSAKK